MAAKTFAELKDAADSPDLIRRSLQGVAFMAPMSETLPAAMMDATDTGKLADLGANFWPVGIVGSDGFVFSADLEKTETEAWGYSVPPRVDIDKAPKQVKMTPLERQRKHLQELILGVDLSGVAADATTGEVVFEEPDLPEDREYRLFVVYMDGTPAKPFYRGKGFARVKRTEAGEETWSADESAAGQEITVDVLPGPEGFAVRHYLGGSAFDATKYGYGA